MKATLGDLNGSHRAAHLRGEELPFQVRRRLDRLVQLAAQRHGQARPRLGLLQRRRRAPQRILPTLCLRLQLQVYTGLGSGLGLWLGLAFSVMERMAVLAHMTPLWHPS